MILNDGALAARPPSPTTIEIGRLRARPPSANGSRGARPTVATTSVVNSTLDSNAVVALGVYGGKDSVALALAVARHLDEIGHSSPRVLIHSDLGRVEWRNSLPSCERLAMGNYVSVIDVREAHHGS